MKKKISTLSMSYILFLILLFLSGSLSGVLSEAVYLLAFALPIILALYLTRNDKVEGGEYLVLKSEGIRTTLPLIAPTVSAIMLVSFLTSILIFALTGERNEVDVGDSLIPALISHALLPAIFEEALFRYLPMRLLASHSRRAAVIISAFFFALVHHDFFSIPYAFLAGIIFMTVNLATGSVIPSVIIHFVNNALSVGLLIYADNAAFSPIIYIILGALSCVSLCVIFVRRKRYLERLFFALDRGEGIKLTAEMLIFAGLSLSIAVISLI